MRHIVFSDNRKRRQLESILHPRIREAAARQAASAAGPYHIVVVPLLAESPMRSEMDRILVVDCSTDTQLERLLKRDAESEQQARRMIASQVSREERLAMADDVIRNDRDLEDTRAQVAVIHAKLLSLAGDRAR
jgi:dephospho-CoA kinase